MSLSIDVDNRSFVILLQDCTDMFDSTSFELNVNRETATLLHRHRFSCASCSNKPAFLDYGGYLRHIHLHHPTAYRLPRVRRRLLPPEARQYSFECERKRCVHACTCVSLKRSYM